MFRRKAFTLIELLVVMAIIAILASILFPVFSRARDKARSTQCLSNNRQLALGFAQYTDDYDEGLLYVGSCGWWSGGGGSAAATGWCDQSDFSYSRWDPTSRTTTGGTSSQMGYGFVMQPYIGSTNLLYCNSSLQDPGNPNNLSYALTNGTQFLATAWGWRKLANWARPTQTIWAWEWCVNHDGGNGNPAGEEFEGAYPMWQGGLPYALLGPDHGMNVSYLDGHAKYFVPAACPPGQQLNAGASGTWDFWWFNGYDAPNNMY